MQLAPIGTARLLEGARPLKANNVNPTYLGQIMTSDGVVRSAIIKDVGSRELGVELLVAALGKLMGYTIPNAFLAISEKALPSAKGPTLASGQHLFFASENAHSPPLGQFLRSSAEGNIALLKNLATRPEIRSLFALDIWTANVDRHAWNLLIGPTVLWFIDHGQCLGGAHTTYSALKADHQYPQKVTADLAVVMTEKQKTEVVEFCSTFPSSSAVVDAKTLLSVRIIEEVLGKPDFDLIASFIDERKLYVPKLGASLMGKEILV